jgi:hypothetical protein
MHGTNTQAVAETALLLMLAALRDLADLDRACRMGRGWALGAGLQERVGELRGRTVWLVGAGMVPRALMIQAGRFVWADGESREVARDSGAGGLTGIHPTRDGGLYISVQNG